MTPTKDKILRLANMIRHRDTLIHLFDENSVITTNEKYNTGFGIDVYNNEMGLCSTIWGSDGKCYARWVYPQKGKDRVPADKAIPMRITLGNRQQAIQRLKEIVAALEDMGGGPDLKDDNGEDIPF